MVVKRVAFVLFLTIVACPGNPSAEDCSEERRAAIDRGVAESDAIADTIEVALDVQPKGGLSESQLDLLRRAQQRARRLSRELEQVTDSGCG